MTRDLDVLILISSHVLKDWFPIKHNLYWYFSVYKYVAILLKPDEHSITTAQGWFHYVTVFEIANLSLISGQH